MYKRITVPLVLIFILAGQLAFAQVTGTFTDARDGKVYKTVVIGKQTWMAENLAYKTLRGCWAYDNDANHISIYGYLYDWAAAKEAAPASWHLPSDGEWKQLTKYLGGVFDGGEKLKAQNTCGTGRSNGTNESGFSGLPAGQYAGGIFAGKGNLWTWWSATSRSKILAYCRKMEYDQYWVSESLTSQVNAYSVRCIKN